MRRWLERLEGAEYENRKLETLSKGNQQKVQLAQTLVCDPDLIILDEPFSGLDPVNSQILKDVIQEQIQAGKLVVFSSHQMNYVEEFCEDIVLINRGEVVLDGNLRKIKQDFGHNRLVLTLAGKDGGETGRGGTPPVRGTGGGCGKQERAGDTAAEGRGGQAEIPDGAGGIRTGRGTVRKL